eukprot:TRINITY_DN11610_c0_g1_i4.p2 TRINITY_DN11610_c0_g1~~TRINITY_DN11610_c0_g1_i4.p2  ORF type:complete len:224 (-),score=50.79 TRINITY_DN11610_c0_g1_i4:1918-2511(-)
MCIRDRVSTQSTWDYDTSRLEKSDGIDFLIINCTFTENFAGVKGGGLFWNFVPPITIHNSIFLNNTAVYGNDIGAYPVAFALYEDHKKLHLQEPKSLSNATRAINEWCHLLQSSGREHRVIEINTNFFSTPAEEFSFLLIDPYGAVVKTENASTFVLIASNGKNRSQDQQIQLTTTGGVLNLTAFSMPFSNQTRHQM